MRPVFAGRQFAIAVAAFGMLASTGSLQGAIPSLPVTGDLLGTVVDSAGIPQMGASVQVFNKYQRLVARSFTDPAGRFGFTGLAADLYSVRVSLASFLPASRDQILIKAGLDSVLQIHLATLLSNIDVSYTVPTGAMSEDWKWVLRSSPATRPVTRLLPVDFPESETKLRPHVFSETHAALSVSGGDAGLIDAGDLGADFGTSFALSTNVLGKNQLQVAGTLGQTAQFGPAAVAFCAIYSRTEDGPFASPPEVAFSFAQLGGIGSQLSGTPPNDENLSAAGFPVLRTMSLSVYQVADPLDNVHFEYGTTAETIEYQQHTSRLSPFARLTVDLGPAGSIIASYSVGGRPDELIAHQQYREAALDGGGDFSGPLDTLSRLPQLSDRNGRLEVQSTQDYELGYSKTSGSRAYSVSAFSETVWNGRLNVAGDLSALNPGDLFSDGISPISSYNIGNYERLGYLASANQRLGDFFDVALAYGRMGGFTANSNSFTGSSSSASFLSQKDTNLASLSVKATVPRAGAHILASYGWMDPRTVVPTHIFTTQDALTLPGLNILIRQPLPSFFGMPGRLELTAELRNVLASGYTGINTGDGRQLLLVEAPRVLRGGLKFTF